MPTPTIYTCPMHPQVKQPKPGKCPICGMDLVPLKDRAGEAEETWIHIEKEAREAARIVTASAQKIIPHKEIALTGTVSQDVRQTFLQTAHIGGRIEKLHVQSEGQFIRKGQPIITLYAPELIAAQRELLEVVRRKASYPSLYEATVQKLKNWKLTDAQIEAIIRSRTVQENIPILSDYSGYITAIHIQEGKHVAEGSPLFSILGTQQVWVDLDVPQSDVPWIHKGMPVHIEANGTGTRGHIRTMVPVVNKQSRTLTARALLERPSESLLPGMFVRARAEYAFTDSMVVVPPSAVLWTGNESWIYIQQRPGTFAPRKVHILTEVREGFALRDGLQPGEIYVVEGAYRVDAAAQLAGKPSMLNPAGERKPPAGHHHH